LSSYDSVICFNIVFAVSWCQLNKSMFTDSHSHIHFTPEFPDVADVIARAENNDVKRQVLVGCGPRDCFALPAFLNKYKEKDFWGSVGVHPHDADKVTEVMLKDFARLIDRADKIVAIGEIGLDYYRNLQPENIQKRAFITQLDFAKQLGMTVIIHVRDAWDDAFKILMDLKMEKVILHTYSGGMELAKKFWDKGYYMGISGVVTYPKNELLREIVAEAPMERLLLESDCPYLSPQRYRGQRNEPAYIVETANEIARVRNVDVEEVAQVTSSNTLSALGVGVQVL